MEGSRRLCGASRELWEGCRRFWKGSGRKILIFDRFLKVWNGRGPVLRPAGALPGGSGESPRRLLAALGSSRRAQKAPGRLPVRSGEVAGGFGGVLVRF